LEREHVVGLVRRDFDVQVLLGLEFLGRRDGQLADFVEGVGRVGDQFSQEDVFV